MWYKESGDEWQTRKETKENSNSNRDKEKILFDTSSHFETIAFQSTNLELKRFEGEEPTVSSLVCYKIPV